MWNLGVAGLLPQAFAAGGGRLFDVHLQRGPTLPWPGKVQTAPDTKPLRRKIQSGQENEKS